MVFSSYNSTSYLPLDNDQSVTFYKNENRLFPTAIVPPTVLARPLSARGAVSSAASSSLGHMSDMSTTDMLTAAYEQQQQQHHHHHRELIGGSASASLIAGDCPFGRVQSPAASTAGASTAPSPLYPVAQRHHRPGAAVAMCDDFQPVAYLNGSSNGYYGYVPSLTTTGQQSLQHTLNNNDNAGLEQPGHHRPPRPTAATLPVVQLPSVRFHGNEGRQSAAYQLHPGCDDNEQLNNNNNNNDNNNGSFSVGPSAVTEPLPSGNFLHHARKRKEISGFTSDASQRYDDEAMDTNAALDGVSESKRRKTEQEGYPDQAPSFPFGGEALGDPYRPEQQQAIEMECQDQQESHHHHPLAGHPPTAHPSATGVNYANGFHSHTPALQPVSLPYATAHEPADGHQHPTSKSKYFDSSRCMMSHMI